MVSSSDDPMRKASAPSVADSGESVGEVQEAMRDRDRRDQERADSPLRVAEDSVSIDTTDLSPDEVVERIAELARERGIA